MSQNLAKENAACAALKLVKPGMLIGLGSGSTADIFIDMLGKKYTQDTKNFNIRALASSQRSAEGAQKWNIPLLSPKEDIPLLDLTIDGADEIDPNFNMIKGGGACLLREKIIAQSTKHMVIIVDENKLVATLGAFALPIEIDPFGVALTKRHILEVIHAQSGDVHTSNLRMQKNNQPLITDGGHYIFDCQCKAIPNSPALAQSLNAITGVIEHGLFIDLAHTLIVGTPEGANITYK